MQVQRIRIRRDLEAQNETTMNTTIQIVIERMTMRRQSNVCKAESKESGVLSDGRTFTEVKQTEK